MNKLIGLLCIGFGCLIFCSCGNKHAEKPVQQSDTAQAQAPVVRDTVMAITAAYIDSVFHADPKAATSEYKGKSITIHGEIKAIHKSKSTKRSGLNWITLQTGSKDILSHVMCTSPDADFLGELKVGQEVTVKGTCIGIVKHNVHIKDSGIVQ